MLTSTTASFHTCPAISPVLSKSACLASPLRGGRTQNKNDRADEPWTRVHHQPDRLKMKVCSVLFTTPASNGFLGQFSSRLQETPTKANQSYKAHTDSAESFHIFVNQLTLTGTSLQGPSPGGKAVAETCVPPAYVLSLWRRSAQDRNQCPAVKRRDHQGGSSRGSKILADATFFSTLFQYTHKTQSYFEVRVCKTDSDLMG